MQGDTVLVDSIKIDGNQYLRKQYPEQDAMLVRVYFSQDHIYREYYTKNHDFDRYFKEWDSDGHLLIHTPYRNGKAQGHCQEWNAAGTRIMEGDLNEGAGTLTYYYDDGVTKRQVDIIDKKGIYVQPPRCYDQNGKKIDCPTLSPSK